MKRIAVAMALVLLSARSWSGPLDPDPAPVPRRDPALDRMMENIVQELTAKYSRTHRKDRVAACVIDLGTKDKPMRPPAMGSWRGSEQIYPASIIKVFYMAAAYAWAEAGKLEMSSQVKYDLKIMIDVSSNTATQRTLNRICGVQPGDLLSKTEFEKFAAKRNQVNEWLRGLGFAEMNACQGTWDGTPSPRDRQLLTMNMSGSGPYVNHNKLSAEEMARFLWLIADDLICTPEDCEAMRQLMRRDLRDGNDEGNGRRRFKDMLPDGTTLYSKSGYTSDTSHDAGIIIAPSGRRFVLAVMSELYYDTTGFLGYFAKETLERLDSLDRTEAEGHKPSEGRHPGR